MVGHETALFVPDLLLGYLDDALWHDEGGHAVVAAGDEEQA